jgi:hypothetical protein
MVLYSWFDAILRSEHCRETHWGINQSLTTQRHFLVAEGAGATRDPISGRAGGWLMRLTSGTQHERFAARHWRLVSEPSNGLITEVPFRLLQVMLASGLLLC